MIRHVTCCVLFAVICTALVAQQGNSPLGSLVFNGIDGPPFPINPVNLAKGVTSTFAMQGIPNAPFIVAGSNSLSQPGLPFNGGLVDLNLNLGFSIAVNGLTNVIWSMDQTGNFYGSFVIASSTATGASRCWQGLVADFTNPNGGATLTAATRTVVVPGITTVVQNIGSNSYGAFSLTPYQTTIPFYNQTYSQIFIGQDGFVSFQNGIGDFTPSDVELLTLYPRIAGYWTDLEPGANSVIDVQIDQTNQSITSVTVRFLAMVEWAGTGSPHSFMIRMWSGSGDIQIINSVYNNVAQYDIVVGICPGGLSGSVVTYPWTNLGNYLAVPFVGTVNQPIYEWFGMPGFPYYSPQIVNPFDLTGRTLNFSPTAIGTAQARYTLLDTWTQGF